MPGVESEPTCSTEVSIFCRAKNPIPWSRLAEGRRGARERREDGEGEIIQGTNFWGRWGYIEWTGVLCHQDVDGVGTCLLFSFTSIIEARNSIEDMLKLTIYLIYMCM